MNIDATLVRIPQMSEAQRKQLRANAQEKIASGDAKWAVAAPKVLEALDAQALHEGQEHVATAQALPKDERVAYAFTQMPPSETQERLIRVLLDNPGSTNAELSRHLGWKDNGWDLHFGSMAKDRMPLLWTAEPSKERDDYFYCGILTTFDRQLRTYVMRPEVVEGLASIGLKRRRP